MGFLLFLLLCIAGVWLLVHLRRRRSVRASDGVSAPPRSKAGPPRTSTPPPSSGWQAEDPPTGEFLHLSTEGRLGIVGEAYRDRALLQVVRRRRVGTVGDWDAGLVEAAILEREPNNPYDGDAVRVRMPANGSWATVGYIAAVQAPRWHGLLNHLSTRGATAVCKAMIYRDRNGRGHQVVLHVPDPEVALPGNALPPGAARLDAVRSCAVVGEQHFQDVLARIEGRVWATLHPSTVPSGKYAGDFTIEVRIDGQPVGTLTAAQGSRYARLLDAGDPVACEAVVADGPKKREVSLLLPRVD